MRPLIDTADVLLIGRVTYDSFYGAWPHREGPMAKNINTTGKVAALKASGDGPALVVGNASLAQTSFAEGMVTRCM
ncbi:MAG: hypothetical protein ABJC79_00170 [Acidimicrobiia bacterium]